MRMSQKPAEDISFGEWLRQRRHILDLTQQELADQVGCARITLRRIEAGALKPSKELAQILLEKLGVPEAERDIWLRFARGLSGIPGNRVDDPIAKKPLTNLPVALTSFIGREREQAEIKALITKNRLVTLTGPGGSGKTRLAMQVAMELTDIYRNGVWWVELAALKDSILVPQTVMKAVGLPEQSGRTPIDSLMDYFQSKHVLLILDNCEHLIDACAQLVMKLLQTCRELSILATSREALNVDGEIACVVPSLQVPQSGTPWPIAQLREYDAVRLLIERVKASEQGFQLTDQNATAVVHICQQLAGIPLAIELAAARVKVLSIEQIAARLEDALQLLTEGKRTAPQRQQTLRATMDWSYDLLTEKEQILFRRSSVFAGGFTLEAAEAVCTGDDINRGEVLDLLKYLVDKSLIVKQVQGIEARYRLLEPIWQYAREKLIATGEEENIQSRHSEFFTQFAVYAEPALEGPDQVTWLHRLETEHDNFRAALVWALKRGDSDGLLRLSGALAWFWYVRGHLSEGQQWLQRALGMSNQADKKTAESRTLHIKVLIQAGILAWAQGDHKMRRALAEESLALSREAGDRLGMAYALHGLGDLTRSQGDYTAARALYEECLTLIRETGDKSTIPAVLNSLGLVAHAQSDYETARRLYQESLALSREMGNKQGIASSLNFLGFVAQAQDDYAGARVLHEESMALSREIGDKRGIATSLTNLGHVNLIQRDFTSARTQYSESLKLLSEARNQQDIVHCLVGWANFAEATGQAERAAKLCGFVEALLQATGRALFPEREMYEKTITTLRSQLDEATSAAAWAAGKAMSTEQAIAFALQED